MTGFGSGQVELDARRIAIEIRSVNHRYLDIRWHVLGEIEVNRSKLDRRLSARLHRGRVDVRVVLETDGGATEQVEVDEDAVANLVRVGRALGDRLQLQPIRSVTELLSVPGVVKRRALALDATRHAEVERAFDAALDEIVEMRQREGQTMVMELQRHLDVVSRWIAEIESQCQPGVQQRLERMKDRLRVLLDGHPVDETRLLQEAAILADRIDVTEELERLTSHVDQMRALLQQDAPVGRRLDFLLQEANREVNTIGSKSTEVDVAHLVVELKSELEKMREQSQNVE